MPSPGHLVCFRGGGDSVFIDDVGSTISVFFGFDDIVFLGDSSIWVRSYGLSDSVFFGFDDFGFYSGSDGNLRRARLV